VSHVFDALGDPTRRHIVESLSRGEASATQLASSLPVTRQAVAKHLTALRSAGLVEGRREGRETLYRLNARPLEEAAAWMARVGGEWDGRLARLKAVVEQGDPSIDVPHSS
jgi:DNA-binding transcriptional ArsR family regulator